jgi:Domain of unknown function (DUF3899)
MNSRLNKRLLILAIFQLVILAVSFIFYHEISLLSYINISFYFSAVLLLSGLLIHTIHSGFFDVVSRSFNLIFSRSEEKRKFHEIPALSELVSINKKPLFFYGLMIGLFMGIALIVFYG